MGRRSDHSRSELEALIVAEGRRQMAEVGFARFSAREVAKRIGYSIGTLYNVFGSYDGLILAINARTLSLWTAHARLRLAQAGEDRIACLVRAYFEFASENYNTWAALYDHRLAERTPAPEWYQAPVAELLGIVAEEVAAVMPEPARASAPALARSLIATVHGHCAFALNKTFSLLGETAPIETALARVREAIAATALEARI